MKPAISTSLRRQTSQRPTEQKTREILSFTSAAVQALADTKSQEGQQVNSLSSTSKQVPFAQRNGSSSNPFSSADSNRDTSSLSSDQRAVLKLGADLSSSSSSQSISGQGQSDRMDLSSLDGSFNKSAAVRVRVSSRLLREIKSPLETSVDRSGVPSVPDPQPTPKVVRHVNGPSAWISMEASSPLPEHKITTQRGPTSATTVFTHEVTQAKDLDVEWKENKNPRLQSPSTESSREALHEENKQYKQKDHIKLTSELKKSHNGTGLCQGDPVTGVITINAGTRDSVKAKSFVLSQRERTLKEEFTKRQDRRSAPIKRSVQPTIIPTKETQKPSFDAGEALAVPVATENPVASAAAIAAAAAAAATAPFLHVDAMIRKLEELQQQLLNTQGSQMNQRPLHPSHVAHCHTGHDSNHGEPSMGVAMASSSTGCTQTSDIPVYMEPFYSQVSMTHYQNPVHSGVPHPSSAYQPTNQPIPSYMERHYECVPQPSFVRQPAQDQSNPVSSSIPVPSFAHQPVQNQTIPSHATTCYQYPITSSAPQPSFTHQPVQTQPVSSHDTMHYQYPITSSIPHQPSTHQSVQTQPFPSHATTHLQYPITSSIPHQPSTHPSVQTQPSHATTHLQYPITSSNPQSSTHQPVQTQPFPSHATTHLQHPITSSNPQSSTHQPVQTQPTATHTGTVCTQTLPPSYTPAKQRLQQQLSSKSKSVKNSKTQTSLQDSSISSSDSPLQTPLPRKKPPRPTPHSYSKALNYLDLPTREKRVHFDQSEEYDPYMSYSKYAPKQYTDQQIFQSGPIRHITSTTKPRPETASPRTIVQAREKQSDPGMEKVMDELSRMRYDLRNVMTETEKMRSGLSQQKIAEDVEQRFSRHTKEPSPLDAYLTRQVSRQPQSVKSYRTTAPVVDNCADIKQILKDVQTQRNNLEHNLDAIVRQNEEENLYAVVDSMIHGAQGAETVRIRHNIDKMIKEVTTVVKNEIDIESRKAQAKSAPTPTTDVEKLKPKTKFQPGKKIPGKSYTLTGRQARVGSGKENVPDNAKEKKVKNARPTSTSKSKLDSKPIPKPAPKPVPKPAAKPVSSGTNQTYLTSIYGRQPYHAHRTTSKAPYLHYQSPVNPRTAALTSAILGTGNQCRTTFVSEPIRERNDKPYKDRDAWYYFHPAVDRSQVIPSGDGRVHVHAPLEGRKMPMAIPLRKPRTDPSLRLPLPTTTTVTEPARQDESLVPPAQSTPLQPSPKPSPTKSNVAVITIRHEGLEEESSKKRRKTDGTATKRSDLAVQVLPQMDVDSLTESCEETPRYESRISDTPQPVTRPADIEYEDFRNYLSVRDTEPDQESRDDDEEDDTPRIPTPENPLTFEGRTEKDRLYHGPPFPPQHPPLPCNVTAGVLDADKRMSDAIEDRALEWVEQELLARIVSEMNQPLPDPTLVARPPPSPESSDVSDDGEVLAATIGLGGIQLFVDAGLPVDRDLVAELVRDVVAEQIASTLGYPKPTATPRQPQVEVQESPRTPEPAVSPVTTPVPTPVYTPAESESSVAHSPTVATPDRTPTPSESSVTIETEEEPVSVKEESEPEVSVTRSPVPTPVATPTGSHTPTASVSTPEPSTREPDVTDIGSPVVTPEPSISVPSPVSASISTPTTVESSVTPPPKPPTPVTASPSSVTVSTLSPSVTSTMTTIDEELSDGQLIQPYVHGGKYSEGEYAMSPGLVELARERNLPVETLDILGKDEDSRNELIRIALHGLLRRGLYSTSSMDTTAITSTVSTLRDADDFREDSLADYTHSEGEVVFPRDPALVLYGANSISSDGQVDSIHRRTKASPGELSPSALRTNGGSSPGEINTRSDTRRIQPTSPNRRVIAVTPSSPPGLQPRQTPHESRENSDSRSLHKSDLQHQGRQHGRSPSPPRGSSRETSPMQRSTGNNYNQTLPSHSSKDSGRGDYQPVSRPPPIHVPIPPMDAYDSSGYSKGTTGYEQGDTSGDVSSISGGDF